MYTIGLIKEGKMPPDNRVALTPQQCVWLQANRNVQIIVQPSDTRCYTNEDYASAGIVVSDNLNDCDILLGIKEVPINMLLPHKKYLFFSHTKKKQPHNRLLLQSCMDKAITLMDYECITHKDGQRIIGFGFFAGIVGAHNALWAYGKKTGLYDLPRVYECDDYAALIRHYFEIKLPNIKIVLTGSGRVAQGVIDIMHLIGVTQVDPELFVEKSFDYPVYTQLKGTHLYAHKVTKQYKREHFHQHPAEYDSLFLPYAACADILINGIYWDTQLPRLFNTTDVTNDFRLQVIADITDDAHGSVPLNVGEATIIQPVYGIDRDHLKKTKPFLPNTIDVIAVGNLPNELPKDASNYFGEQLMKFVIDDMIAEGSELITNATIVKEGKLTEKFAYLADYAGVDAKALFK